MNQIGNAKIVAATRPARNKPGRARRGSGHTAIEPELDRGHRQDYGEHDDGNR